ncbi:MAG: alpha-L-fucosidase [Pseudomonadota bacterium]|nr:alpha-L-fucosidase [Pseudomonadota bacterium]
MKLLLVLLAIALPAGADTLPKPDRGSVPASSLYDYGVMGPPATPAIVAAADAAVKTALPPGPFRADWDSIARNYQVPAWFHDAKFGIFLHWGLYAVPAHHNEWYEKHMYGADLAWHTQAFGAPEQFGYKDFIPRFTQEKFKADEWASLFRRAGARLVMPSAQHHDNFAMWDSDVTPFNAMKMGPKRDLIGELAGAVRKAGLKFGVSNHGVENFTFINPPAALDARLKAAQADLYDPAWAAFYNVADRSPAAMTRFLSDWLQRNFELIDKYQPDLMCFDNGANLRVLDPLKWRVAAYYYNRAGAWGKQVSISTKYVAFAPSNDDSKQVGSIIDFEKIGVRSPAGIRAAPWMVDDVIGSTWGYTEGMTVSGGAAIVRRLVDTVSKDGFYLLNVSPRADGTIPDDQQRSLLEVGAWLDVNGEAIYGSHAWTRFGDKEWRYTVKEGALYAIGPVSGAVAELAPIAGKVQKVELLGRAGALAFTQDGAGLHVQLGSASASAFPRTLKLAGLALR